jgi:hypothetical protein
VIARPLVAKRAEATGKRLTGERGQGAKCSSDSDHDDCKATVNAIGGEGTASIV